MEGTKLTFNLMHALFAFKEYQAIISIDSMVDYCAEGCFGFEKQ